MKKNDPSHPDRPASRTVSVSEAKARAPVDWNDLETWKRVSEPAETASVEPPAPDAIEPEPAPDVAPAPAPTERAPAPAAAVGKGKAGKAPPAPPPAAKKTYSPILIVDESADDVDLIRDAALEEGCEVHAYRRAVGLLNEIARLKPVVMFLDKNLKQLNLVQVCRQARTYNVAVILLGRFLSREEILMALNMGVVDFLIKPLTAEVVVPKVLQSLAYAKSVLKRIMDFPTLAPEAAALPPKEKIKKVLEQVKEVMALPQTASRIIEMSGQPDSDADNLTKVAETDTAIATMLLKRANSAAYGALSQIKSLREAIVRLGFRMVRSIATLLSVFNLSGIHQKSFGFNRLGHWVHSLSVGVLAEALATQTKFKQTEDVFLAGVLHDFGKLVFDDYVHDDYTRVLKMADEQDRPLREAERDYFGVSHDQIGSQIARRWKLPDTICQAVALHHERDRVLTLGPDDEWPIESFVHVADQMAKALLLGDSGDTHGLTIPAPVWERMGLKEKDRREWIEQIMTRVTELVKWLNIPHAKTGLIAPAPAKNKWIAVVEAGAPDRALDLFFAKQGYEVLHTADAARPEGAPAFLVFDARNGLPTEAAIGKAPSPKIGTLAIVPKAETPPAGLPLKAVPLPAPIDYLALMQHIHDMGG